MGFLCRSHSVFGVLAKNAINGQSKQPLKHLDCAFFGLRGTAAPDGGHDESVVGSVAVQIEELQKKNTEQAKAHAAEMAQLKLDNAVDTALTAAGAKNSKAVKALLDCSTPL